MLLAVKSASIVASAPITNELFFGSKWNNDELISILESLPLMNCVDSVPMKKVSAMMSMLVPSN